MPEKPSVIISAFADESANRKTALEQMSALAAIGLRYYSPRFIDVQGNGEIKHVVDLGDEDLDKLLAFHQEYGVSVTSIGSRIGKVKLQNVDDGTHNKYVPIETYLDTEVDRTIRVANKLGTRLIRGFSFYHPKGTSAHEHVPQAAEQIRKIVDRCAKANLVYGLEIEPNLVGETGSLLAALAQQVNHPNMVLIFDGGNVAAQNKNPVQVYHEYLETVDYLGWMHIKDYRIDTNLKWEGHVDEERLKNFVPCDRGDAGHELIFRDLRTRLPKLIEKMRGLGVPGFFLEVEPHLKGGGQFGGFSGPDGTGVAVRALCNLLDYSGIDYSLRSFEDIQVLRGF